MLTAVVQTGQNTMKAESSSALNIHATGARKMTQERFDVACAKLEADGYTIVEYQKYNHYAVYQKNGETKTIGRRRK